MVFLLTWHGTLLCRQRQDGVLVHRPLTDRSGDAEPVELDIPIVSLIEFGRYQGQIAVPTDRWRAQLAELLPADMIARLVIIPFTPSDRHGFMTARYLILDIPSAWQFQSIRRIMPPAGARIA